MPIPTYIVTSNVFFKCSELYQKVVFKYISETFRTYCKNNNIITKIL